MSKLIINEPPLLVLPSLAKVIGLNEAITLQQIHYWLDPRVNKNFKEGLHWVYNSYEEWQGQFPFWSIRTIRRNIQALEESHLLISKTFNSNSFDKTKWYSINYEVLEQLTTTEARYVQFGHIDRDSVDTSNRSNSNSSIRTGRTKELDNMDLSYIETKTTTKNITKNSLSKIISTLNTSKPESLIKNKDNERENEMLKIWNEVVEEKNEVPIKLTTKREQLLSLRLQECFSNDIAVWTDFCHKIASSKFLMGEITNFKAQLDWTLKEENLLKIIENSYVIGDRLIAKNNTITEISQEEISDPIWKQTRAELKKQLGEGIFISWISKLEFLKISDQIVYFKVPTKFIRQWIIDNFSENIKRSFNANGADIQQIFIQYNHSL